MRARRLLLGAFFVSGAAGLAYELVWSRYLALLLGHSAHAQVVVIAVYLGGMALGAMVVSGRVDRIGRPLLWYARTEVVLAVLGLAFHPVYLGVSGVAYELLLPRTPDPLAALLPWTLAVLLILPQAALLGATFPLMTGGLLRGFASPGGRTVADAYLWNALGGAVGILVAGFLLIPLAGTVGCLVVAALGNMVAAGAAFALDPGPRATAAGTGAATATGTGVRTAAVPAAGSNPSTTADRTAWAPALPTLEAAMLVLAFLTAVASFMYEIAWIRMLSLVMGSATHSFELMLSAFIFGLALGSRWVRDRVDTSPAPLRLLGGVQWLMGLAALATLPLYAASFGIMTGLVGALQGEPAGYVAFSLARYALALAIMLPSTVMAGATLPLMTGILLRRGVGERAVGRVYGMNTLGSVTGVVAAALILLPLLGLKGLLVTGALLDMTLGVGLLAWSRGSRGKRLAPALGVAAVTGLACAGALGLVRLDRAVLTGGGFRSGDPEGIGGHDVLFYEDGRTATVGVHGAPSAGLVVLTSNGKPDASLPIEWIRAAGGAEVTVEGITSTDAATQTLAPLVLLAHMPAARSAVNIGHGSGMSVSALLGSPTLEEVVTVEIEPAMVRGSQLFRPANDPAFDDARHDYVFDDARSWMARTGRRWDLILSEPSNPWVSGVATLFTEEFYRRLLDHMADDGVFGQWLQIYEMEDRLITTVLTAIHRVFPDYRAYLVGTSDLLIVAGRDLPEPDWSVASLPGVRRELSHLPPFEPAYLDALFVFDRAVAAPLLGQASLPANSEFRPLLERGAERARFRQRSARGTYGLASDRFDLAAALSGRATGEPGPYATPPVWAIEPMRTLARARWMRQTGTGGQEVPAPPVYDWRRPHTAYRLLSDRLSARVVPGDWSAWARHVEEAEAAVHAGTAGWADEAFYGELARYLDAVDAPREARAVVGFLHGLAAWEWDEAARAADVLRTLPEPLLDPGLLLDGAVVAYLRTERVADARAMLEWLAPLTDRDAHDLRTRLLRAHVRAAAEDS